MARTMSYTETLVVEKCWCGIAHAVPVELVEHARKSTANGVFCPLGHRWVFTESEADRLRKELEREQRRTATMTSRLDQEKASHASTKGQLTKTRKRAAAGICPCCKRSYVQMARHMATKHPDFAKEPQP